MLALAATFVGFSAFKFVEKNTPPESGWYEISHLSGGSFDLPEYQKIEGHLENGPQDDCSPFNAETDPCAVLLDLSDFDELSIVGMNVYEATEVYDAEINLNSGGEDDGYARRDE